MRTAAEGKASMLLAASPPVISSDPGRSAQTAQYGERRMLLALASRLPPRLVRAVGRAQFRSPLIGRIVRAASSQLTGTGTIRSGVGAGLQFDGAGGYPGYLLGTSEPEEQAFVAAHLDRGDVFYDIGANIGFYSTIGARLVGPTGQVYAFEPHPDSAVSAARNATMNGFANVEVVTAAVSDHDDRMTLSLAGGSASHRLDDAPGIEVDVVALDGWLERTAARPPTLVMIDVEGAEIDVLRGMRRMLAVQQPTICCEVHWLGKQFLDFCARELAPFGYTVSELAGGPPPASVERWHAVLRPEARRLT
jgi:FkbM family methyltransferase